MAKVVLTDLRKSFGSVQAVKGISLTVEDGEFFCLLGPSGCGKTTVLRIIAGFEYPTSGGIAIDGKDVTAVPPHQRSIGMVFQNYALFPHMTVEQNLWFGLSMHHIPRGEARRRIANILELLGLTGLSLRYPRQLSGGEQQRVAVGRVLVLRPRVLLFDEPLSNLDAKLRKETRYEIRRLQREIATTAVYVTHDQEEAMAIADRIGVMKDGQIEQEGQPAQVYEQPRTRFIADFIGTSNFLQATAVWVNGNRAMFRTLEGLDVLVELQDGQEPLLAGSERTIAIRAEKLSLSPVRREAIVPLGRVLSAVKLGPITEVRIALLGGRQLLVHVTKQDAASINEPGQEVELSWPPDGWFVLSE